MASISVNSFLASVSCNRACVLFNEKNLPSILINFKVGWGEGNHFVGALERDKVRGVQRVNELKSWNTCRDASNWPRCVRFIQVFDYFIGWVERPIT